MTNWGAIEWFVARLIMTAGCVVVAMKLSRIATTPSPGPSFESAFVQIVTAEELAAYKAIVLEAAAKPSTRCARPVLRGVSLAETAPDPAFARCVDEWRAVISHAQRTPEKLAVLERCGATLETGMRAAIQRGAACSPNGLGGPELESGVLFPAQALGERARVMADAGDVQGALWLLLEVMRYGQDSARGRTDLMMSMLGTAVVDQANDHAVEILAKAKPINIDELATAVDALIASEPAFGEAAEADGYRVALDWGLPALEPASWVPPGGRRKDATTPADPADEEAWGRGIVMLVVGKELSAKVAQACPVGASLAVCYRGFALPLRVISSDGTSRTLVRQALVESQTASSLATWPLYVAKRALSHAGLIALRIQLEVLRNGCGDRAALAKLASTPTLGDTMRLDYALDALTISSPAWVGTGAPRRIVCAR